jgi:hypothetical protein
MNTDTQLTSRRVFGCDSRSIGMKTSTLDKRSIGRVGFSLLAIFAGLALLGAGCQQSAEGDRCNPALSHNDCNAGLVCTIPTYCVENYCCPVSGPITSPFCQPGCNGGAAADGAMPPTGEPEEAGEDASGEDASTPATDATMSSDSPVETSTSSVDASGDVATPSDAPSDVATGG